MNPDTAIYNMYTHASNNTYVYTKYQRMSISKIIGKLNIYINMNKYLY